MVLINGIFMSVNYTGLWVIKMHGHVGLKSSRLSNVTMLHLIHISCQIVHLYPSDVTLTQRKLK